MEKAKHAWKTLDSEEAPTSRSTGRKIFAAVVTITLLTAIVKVLVVVKELVVAWKFGTADALDAFFIALLVPSFIINIVAGSFNSSFIPTYIRVREVESVAAARRLYSSVMVWGIALLFITAVLLVITAPLYLPVIARGFSAEKLQLTFQLLCVIAPIVLLSGIVSIWGAILNADERFALAALCPIFAPIISVLLLLAAPSWGVFALAAGLVFGAVFEVVSLGAALKRQGIPLWPRWHGRSAHLRQVAGQYVPMAVGAFVMGGTFIVDQAMAAMLAPGSVASLNYGNRLIASITGLAAMGLGTAVTPYISSIVVRRDWAEVRHILKRYLLVIFCVCVPLTILLIAASEPLIKLLLQRGAFTAEDAHLVARIQSFYALQLPFFVASILLVRLISALHANRVLLRSACINLIVNVTLNYLFIRWLGVAGIALSTTVVYLVSFIYCWIIVIHLIPKAGAIEREP